MNLTIDYGKIASMDDLKDLHKREVEKERKNEPFKKEVGIYYNRYMTFLQEVYDRNIEMEEVSWGYMNKEIRIELDDLNEIFFSGMSIYDKIPLFERVKEIRIYKNSPTFVISYYDDVEITNEQKLIKNEGSRNFYEERNSEQHDILCVFLHNILPAFMQDIVEMNVRQTIDNIHQRIDF